MSTVRRAMALAYLAHQGQVDKAGKPYILHPRAVATALEPYGDAAVATGWLHDVVEDTSVTLKELSQRGFSDEVVNAVDSVTHRAGEPYEDAVRRAAANRIGRLVKLADNAHNSDEDRLALLPEKTATRLRRKYARARIILEHVRDGVDVFTPDGFLTGDCACGYSYTVIQGSAEYERLEIAQRRHVDELLEVWS